MKLSAIPLERRTALLKLAHMDCMERGKRRARVSVSFMGL
jgi:hypothetical protein